MAQHYSDPKRASDPHALPDVEVFALDGSINDDVHDDEGKPLAPGWYWWACFPGCLPDGDPVGPFATEQEAIDDAQDGAGDDEEDDAPTPQSGYTSCACRDCMETAISNNVTKPELCSECVDAGCEADAGTCCVVPDDDGEES